MKKIEEKENLIIHFSRLIHGFPSKKDFANSNQTTLCQCCLFLINLQLSLHRLQLLRHQLQELRHHLQELLHHLQDLLHQRQDLPHHLQELLHLLLLLHLQKNLLNRQILLHLLR